MIIRYYNYFINDKWKEAVKKDPRLTKEQKKALIWEARKEVFLSNLEEFIFLIIKIIAINIVVLLIYWVWSLFS